MLTAELWVGAMAKRLSMFAATLTLLRAGIYGRVAYFWNAMSVDFQYVDVYVIHDDDDDDDYDVHHISSSSSSSS